MPSFAKSCQKGCAKPATKHLMYWSCAAKSRLRRKFTATRNPDEQTAC